VADIVVDGQTRLTFAAAVANIALPTASELNAGILLQSVLTPDGVMGFEPTTADVDNSALNSTFDTKTIGRTSFSGTKLQFKKQSSGDVWFTTLTRGTTGFIIIRRYIPETTAWTSAQGIAVYPIICGDLIELSPVANAVAKWQVETKITSSPNLRAAVA
jgi:hypothetical protein